MCTGGLAFRIGHADETVRHRGTTHIVEHLALFNVGHNQSFSYNAVVSGLFTTFLARGTPELVGRFFNEVTHNLRDLPLHRLDVEMQVLRTEAAATSVKLLPYLLWLRLGPRGHGLSHVPERALTFPDPTFVRSWAQARFTAGNAALWLTGPPPSNLALDLPAGRRVPPPTVAPSTDVRYPASIPWSLNYVAVSFVRPRIEWLKLALAIAGQRVLTRLRLERGLTYETGVSCDPIDRDHTHGVLWASCLPENGPAVRDGIIGILDDLSTQGPTEEELDLARGGALRSLKDPDVLLSELSHFAVNELLGCEVVSFARQTEKLLAVDGAEVARHMAAARERSLLALPPSCPPPARGFSPYPAWSNRVMRARSFRSGHARFPWSKGHRLHVDRNSVSFVSAQGETTTLPYASCAAAMDHTDGAFEVLRNDGCGLIVDPRHWREGAEAVRMLRAAIPPDRIVPHAVEGQGS